MKTLYDILEVSKQASKEVIEKAYKALAKKYHPDLQKEEDKKIAEQKMKEINEAYFILSNNEKKEIYDEKLKQIENQEEQEKVKKIQEEIENKQIKKEEYIPNYNQNQEIKEEKQQIKEQKNQEIYQKQIKKMQKEQMKNIENQYNQIQQKAYEDYLRSLGYKIKYKWTWQKTLRLIKAIIILTVSTLIIWYFPPTHKMLINIYESNIIIKTAIDIIKQIFIGLWNAISSIFKSK